VLHWRSERLSENQIRANLAADYPGLAPAAITLIMDNAFGGLAAGTQLVPEQPAEVIPPVQAPEIPQGPVGCLDVGVAIIGPGAEGPNTRWWGRVVIQQGDTWGDFYARAIAEMERSGSPVDILNVVEQTTITDAFRCG
jgi:hypothetical protein